MNYNWDWGIFFKSTGIGDEIYLEWFITCLLYTSDAATTPYV